VQCSQIEVSCIKVGKARSTSLHERFLRSSAAQFSFQQPSRPVAKLLQSVAHLKFGGGNRLALKVSPIPEGRRSEYVRIYIEVHWFFRKKYVVTSAVSPPGHDRFSWLWEAVWGEVLHFLSASTWQSSQHVILIYGQSWIRAGKAASERKLCWYLLICGRCQCTDSLIVQIRSRSKMNMDSAVGLDAGAQEHWTSNSSNHETCRCRSWQCESLRTCRNFCNCVLLLGCPKTHQHALSEEV